MYVLIGFIVVILGYLIFRLRRMNASSRKANSGQIEIAPAINSDCCGAHEICEFDASAFDDNEIKYFDDEELDVLRNIREELLTNQQIDQLREVLYTLQPSEIGAWLTSLSRRHIHLPPILKQEALGLLAEL